MTTQTYTVTVSYNKSVEDLIKLGKYDWANDKINSTNFPSTDKGVKELEITLIGYKKEHSSEFILKDMEKNKYRPATLKELLSFGAQHPDLQREDWIAALGSTWRSPDGDVGVPYLFRSDGVQDLCLDWFADGWEPYWRFAAVSLKLKPSELFEGPNSSLRKTFDKATVDKRKCHHGRFGPCIKCVIEGAFSSTPPTKQVSGGYSSYVSDTLTLEKLKKRVDKLEERVNKLNKI